MKTSIKVFTIVGLLALVGCATDPVTEKSMSRDKTMEKLAKTALITEMLSSSDPHIRAKGAAIAEQFVVEPKKNIKSIFGF
jgi:PBP1b-binding outer membrane lipoprotein LpoB